METTLPPDAQQLLASARAKRAEAEALEAQARAARAELRVTLAQLVSMQISKRALARLLDYRSDNSVRAKTRHG